MKRLIAVSMMAICMIAISANTTYAAWLGAVNYKNCGSEKASFTSAKNCCYTVMKTRRKVMFETQKYTCYKTVYEKAYEKKTINCVKYVSETHYRDCQYTVSKPVYEKPERVRKYTVCKPVWETKTREGRYTVSKPVWETKTREICYTVCKPVKETRMRTVCEVVCKPVSYTKTVEVRSGHWETQVTKGPGRVMRKVVREKGCWVWDSKRCRNIFKPGTCRIVKVKCAPREICKKIWVPEVQKKQIKCVRYERETVKKQVPYTVCKMVKEKRTKSVPYRVCHMVKEHKNKTIPYTVCKIVKEHKNKNRT